MYTDNAQMTNPAGWDFSQPVDVSGMSWWDRPADLVKYSDQQYQRQMASLIARGDSMYGIGLNGSRGMNAMMAQLASKGMLNSGAAAASAGTMYADIIAKREADKMQRYQAASGILNGVGPSGKTNGEQQGNFISNLLGGALNLIPTIFGFATGNIPMAMSGLTNLAGSFTGQQPNNGGQTAYQRLEGAPPPIAKPPEPGDSPSGGGGGGGSPAWIYPSIMNPLYASSSQQAWRPPTPYQNRGG